MIIIPMAGKSSRFFDAGYTQPKYELPLAARPVFDYATASFRNQFGSETFLFVVSAQMGAKDFVSSRAVALNIDTFHVLELEEQTAGQAETVALGLKTLDVTSTEPLTIFNIDTFRPGFEMSPQAKGCAGFLEVFKGDGSGWSFVDPDPDAEMVARRVVEKQRISNLCSTGLYYFAQRSLFDQAYAAELANPSQKISEHYIAPLYNQLISRDLKVGYKVLEPRAVIFCGVPAEYEALKETPDELAQLSLKLGF
ncbi:glycosyltransferase family protein [Kordiimonas aestuarii]|uniref:hypothetical protein n=1 Tax=Kordiimonas aestuarii TaxID=1005925 RepID=UPI0021D22141|nr:hypothetical protein [Kordiimonas aestuarii]